MRFCHPQLRQLPLGIALQAALCSPLWATSFTIPTDSGSTAKTLTSGESGAVDSGASLNLGISTAAIAVTGTTGAVTLTNAGMIEQTGTGSNSRAIDVTGNGVKLILNNASGATISAASSDVIRTNQANIVIQIDNQGTMWQKSTGSSAGGQAIDSRGIGAASTGSFIINGSATNTAATIRADADDAIRAGSNTTITNYGTIISNGIVNTKCPDILGAACTGAISASDAIDIGGNLGVVVNNYGTISGPRHGITADNGVTVNNEVGGLIIGRNGSGVGSDGTGTVVNRGTISGRYAGAGNVYEHLGTGGLSTSSNGDGDGVDIDGIGTVTNYGRIEGLGGGGVDSGGNPNGGDGIAMGGGTITNNAGASIWGKSNGILVDDGANGTAIATGRGTSTVVGNVGIGGIVTIINNGDIRGDQKVAIGLVGNFDDVVTNGTTGVISGGTNAVRVDQLLSTTAAAAIQMGGGNDTLTNYGRIEGKNGMAIDMGANNDTLRLFGGTVVGTIDGGIGTNLLETDGTQLFHAGQISNFQNITVKGGNTTFNYALGTVGNVQVDATGNLRVNGAFSTTDLTINGSLQAPNNGALRTVSVAGNYVQGASGALETRIGANNASDHIAVTGTATLANGATIRPLITGAVSDGATYTLISAGTLSANAANLNIDGGNGAFYSYSLQGSGNNLQLVAHQENGIVTVTPRRFESLANAVSAAASNGFTTSQQGLNLLNALQALPTAQALSDATSQLAPETNAAARSASNAAQGSVFAAFDNRMDAVRSGGPLAMGKTGLAGGDSAGNRFWLQGLAAIASQDARKGADGYDLDAQGLAAGYEFDLNTRDMVGFSGGYTQAGSDGKDSGAGDDTDVKSIHVGAYFSRTDISYTIDAGVAVSANRYSSQRTVTIPGFTETLSGDYSGYQIGARAEYGIPFALDEKWSGRWLMGARFAYLDNGAYSESGGASAQNVASTSANSAQSVLGMEFVNKLDAASSITLRTRYLHEFSDTPAVNATFATGGPSFTVDGVQPGRDALQLGLGYRNITSQGTTIAIGYDMEIKDEYLGHQLTAKAIWNF